MERVVIEPASYFDLIVHPTFEDVLPAGGGAYDGMMQDFVVMNNVAYKRPLVDLRPKYNIMRQRDKSCDLIYQKIGGGGLREVETIPVYGATQNCRNEFYQGALRDWRSKDAETFGAKIMPWFQAANRIDMATNGWFGDMARAATTTFSTNAFPGVVTWIRKYIADGTIASSQTFTPAATNYRDPAHYEDAYNAIVNAYNQQTELMHNMGLDKVIYCDEATLVGYRGYLRTLGHTSEVINTIFGNGNVNVDSYNGIPIVVVPLWSAVLSDILGSGYHHMVILTIRKNFIFATDSGYGEGPDGTDALVVWYRYKDLSWYYQQFMVAGTQIALPEFIVFGISA